ncbi:alpha-D-ribose 1-methylphosphonate 5-phosphate C-P lyase [Thermosporothrix hazakensis]|jgi:alpha-D-ribose 1-methylphosphonate 5-phosphate C-P lyase|uniref:Alpha-D-ribose 1-methylphosphonate 5-phosphate C-P lyase n=1 Tax=Thermosporothrix hazakensis TaxID=644383 RepID=A0A326UKK9_THEHA|nr:alpha-D-ribose 1-methylphosphonate 5-phosphate C-P-lyase PhnJ [Thermosporothrix hazakensis]PZW32933.1 alpha-D-ribose 1-methylphosphonate 5-phosphate C-P lyase [Thermosporothrix hazakensis]GCE48965.1 carbon-phosphorus lyase complex subunit PhnJ [Thermosporothrix hazakensis]
MQQTSIDIMPRPAERETLYNFGFIDEDSKREVRRKLLKAVATPGHLIPFASRDLPIARGWGTGGLQITLALVKPTDTVKVIDQGDDDSVNAVNLRRLIQKTTGIEFTTDTLQASIIQTRHRVPEEPLRDDQILVLQVPMADPLRWVEPVLERSMEMHAEADYGHMWVYMYESIVRQGDVNIATQYPVLVEDRYIMDTSPIPRYDVPRMHMAETLYLFGAGREKRVYAIPPFTKVVPLQFEDYPFTTEHDPSQHCALCGSNDTFLTSQFDAEQGRWLYYCSDTSFCQKRVQAREA